jgi:flagellar hook-associated protein FlgK
MKTKLTLNVDDKIVARAKRASARKKVSLSSVVEDYLDKFSERSLPPKSKSKEPSLLERIRKYTHPVDKTDEQLDKQREEYLRKKHVL